MKRTQAYFSLIITSFIFYSCATEKQLSQTSTPENQLSQQLTGSVLWFQKSAEMVAAYYQAYYYADLLLSKKLDTTTISLPPAVVLDIDETVLDNSPYEAQLIDKGITYESSTWKIWTSEARAKALPGALDFVNSAKKNGVEVFYISNRKTDELDVTIQNLKLRNFPNADEEHIILQEGVSSDKTSRREKVAENYNILLFIGDNLTDYSEIYANRDASLGIDLVTKTKEELMTNFIMLPNPMYGEWETAIYNNNLGLTTEEKLKKRKKLLNK